jgi:excisionase family DNA binding protein
MAAVTPESPPVVEMHDARDVATLLACSVRHVHRLHDAGDMPRATRLGRLLRWRRAELLAWIRASCPSPRTTGWRYSASAEGLR